MEYFQAALVRLHTHATRWTIWFVACNLVVISLPCLGDEFQPGSMEAMIQDLAPQVEGLDPNMPLPRDTKPESLPPVLLEIAKDKVRQQQEEPLSFRQLLGRKVRSYFVRRRLQDSRKKLLADAIRVFNEFEGVNPSPEFKGFREQTLQPFIVSLDAAMIESPMRHGVVTEPIGNWSVQTLVVKQMMVSLSRFKQGFAKKAMNLITGRKHLKGATWLASTAIAWTVLHHFFPGMTTTASLAVANTFSLALMTGPVASVTTSAFGFFVRPTNELVKTLGSRMTGDLEAKINNGYDWLVQKYFTKGVNQKNDHVQIATFEEHHTDFAGMSAEDQLKNWARGLNMFIVVQSIFGRLLRDTHHSGRDLMMLAWTDAQNIAQLAELLDTKLVTLQTLQMSILAPYVNAMIQQNDVTRKLAFDERVRAFNSLVEQVWLDPDADQNSIDILAGRIDQAAQGLREFGVSDEELRELLNIQRKRGRTIGKLVTAVSIGHLRSFYGAERNRNLADEARVIARAIQVGLGTEEYTEQYLPLVRRQLRLMGIEYTGADPSSPVADPATLHREECLVQGLRKALAMPSLGGPATYACVNALLGEKSAASVNAHLNNAVGKLMSNIRSQGRKMEVAGLLKYAMVTTQADVEAGARYALETCH